MALRLIPRLILLSLICSGVLSLHAERLPITTHTTADGLPRDHINRIVQDSRGFLWFCTSEGLSRFDGYKFVNYGTEQGLPGREVNDFLETRGGIYWVATNKGLARFNPSPLPANTHSTSETSQRFVVYHPGEDPLAQEVSVIYEDHAGTLWCGTTAGLFRLDQLNGRWVFSFTDIIQPAALEHDKTPRSIIEDRRHSLWIGAESGLYRLRPDGGTERYTDEEGLPKFGNGRALLEDRETHIWLGTGSGLFQLTPDPQPHRSVVAGVYTSRDGLSDNNVNSLLESSDGRFWIGTGIGLSEFLPARKADGGRFRNYTSANGMSDSAPTSIAEDHQHNLWIGTAYGGAMRFAANGFTSYYQTDGLGGVEVASIFDDQAGELCVISNSKHLNRFDGAKFTAARLTLPKGMKYWGWGWYQTMLQDSHGEWWMNTGEGLVRYPKLDRVDQITHAKPKVIYTTRDGLPANEIFRLFEDSHGDIWISTLGNAQGVLTRWERATESFHPYAPVDGVPAAAPTAFAEDRSGNLWIGFYTGELLRYSGGRFTRFTNAEGVPPGFIHGLYLDHAGGLWVATGEGGVAHIDDPGAEHPVFHVYSSLDGLSSNQANCITEDRWGSVYIGTGRGLDKLDPTSGHIKHYSTADGLPNSFVTVAFSQHDGSLWFGTLGGLARFTPQPEPPAAPPTILINSLRIAGNSYPLSELGEAQIAGLVLGPNQNHLEIGFAGLNLAGGESLRYQYRLDGASSDWSAPSDQRSVSYPNLPAGNYRFLVRAVSADGTLSSAPASVSFRLLPPFWQRWWFGLIAVVVLAVPVFFVVRYRQQRRQAEQEAREALQRSREERLKALEQVRRRIATDLHDDIGSSLSQINLLSEVVRQRIGRDRQDVAEPLLLISNASNEMVSSMSDIVWAINPQRDHLSDLVHRMRRFAADTLATRDIDFHFRAPDAEFDMKLGANLRREVFLIFKESINNLVKHAGCTHAEIAFDLSDNSLWLKVSDNGRGFQAGQQNDGHGLGSLRERAGSVGGQLDIVSRVGEGTTISLKVPLTSAEAAGTFDGNGSS